jgi:hypothetical protein
MIMCLNDSGSEIILQKARSEMALPFFMISPTYMQHLPLWKRTGTDQHIAIQLVVGKSCAVI